MTKISHPEAHQQLESVTNSTQHGLRCEKVSASDLMAGGSQQLFAELFPNASVYLVTDQASTTGPLLVTDISKIDPESANNGAEFFTLGVAVDTQGNTFMFDGISKHSLDAQSDLQGIPKAISEMRQQSIQGAKYAFGNDLSQTRRVEYVGNINMAESALTNPYKQVILAQKYATARDVKEWLS